MPSLTLFAEVLKQTKTLEGTESSKKIIFTFADYNDAVLRLVTLPNLLLTWYINCQQNSETVADQNPSQVQPEEELDITPELIGEFKSDLSKRGIAFDFISGGWSPEFVDLVFSVRAAEDFKTLLLASETIYSPASLMAFSETLLQIIRRSSTDSTKSRAMIAAKKVYFGVGGGVDEFLAVLRDVAANELEVQQRVDVQSEGVGRVVLEVTPAAI